MDLDLKFWAGTEESLAMYLAIARNVLEGKELPAAAAAYHDNDSDGPERSSRLVTKSGDLAIIKIVGPLNNTDSWINGFLGMTGYPEIRQALVQVATDAEVQGVILDVNSGGGSVSGVFDTAKLIQQVDKIKPVHAFSDGIVASAAYLLASSARSLAIGRMTEAGSIGVVSVHMEKSKMMKDVGITPTVLRSGKYKAMGNPYEPLSEAAQTEIQGQLDYMYQVFVEHVADRRKVSYDVADKKLAQGRVFIGDRAAEIGLVDAVSTFDDVASKLQRGIDSKKAGSKYAPNLHQGKLVAEKKPLTEQEVAALAAGAAGAAGASTEEQHGGGSGGAPAAEAAIAAGVAVALASPGSAAAAAVAAAVTPTAEKPESEVVGLLKSQLAERDDKVLSLTVELREERAANETLKTSHKGLRAIAEMSVNHLRVALKASGAKVEEMTDAALLAEQTSLREQFEKTFKAGGVASVTTATAEKEGGANAAEDARRRARIEATRTR